MYGHDSLCRKMLLAELEYARLYILCLALRGVSWDRMPLEQRDLARESLLGLGSTSCAAHPET